MPLIEIHLTINAPIQRCFDLARSIDLHKISAADTQEKAIAGKTEGLIELGETVTWRAKHLGVYQKLSVRITAFESPNYFVDEMTKGAFKSFKHEHIFKETPEGTLMIDRFDFKSPFGPIGELFNRLFLTQYMTSFLEKRNYVIKDFAESDNWKKVLEAV